MSETIKKITFTSHFETFTNTTFYKIEVETSERTFQTDKRYSSLHAWKKSSPLVKEAGKPKGFPGKLASDATKRQEAFQKYFEAILEKVKEESHAALIEFFHAYDETDIIQIGEGNWNFRASFKVRDRIELGCHMSLYQLSSGKFLVIDSIPLEGHIKEKFDELTENGSKIEAFIGSHPFHSIHLPAFFKQYPDIPYYGCPRQMKNVKEVKWTGDVRDVFDKWNDEGVEMRLPAGGVFIDPMPVIINHFTCVWVYHKASHSIHIDDTILIPKNPSLILRMAGFKDSVMQFHVSMKTCGLIDDPQSPYMFRDWCLKIIDEWDFDHLVTSHMGNHIGGAKEAFTALVESNAKLFDQIHEKKQKRLDSGEELKEEREFDESEILCEEGGECG